MFDSLSSFRLEAEFLNSYKKMDFYVYTMIQLIKQDFISYIQLRYSAILR